MLAHVKPLLFGKDVPAVLELLEAHVVIRWDRFVLVTGHDVEACPA